MLSASPLALEFAYSQGLYKRHGWVTHTRIDENPAKEGHHLCFDKTCQWQPRLETWNGEHKTVRSYDRADVMSCCKKLSVDGTRASIIFTLRLCVVCVTGPDPVVASEDYLGVREKGTRLAMPKTICASNSSSLKPGSGATEGVLD